MKVKPSPPYAIDWLIVAVLAVMVSVVVPPGCKSQVSRAPTKPTEPAEPTSPAQPPASVVPPAPVFGLEAEASEHYLLYSNAPKDLKADVLMRLEAIYADYRREMADVFKPTPDNEKAKAFFIGDPELFVEAGGDRGAPGVFRVLVDQNNNPVDGIGPRLVLRHSGDAIYLELTTLMQHEGWHQFNWHHACRWAPIWWDEGTAHHYQYSVWTGDTMIHGGIHGSVLQVLMESAPSFIPLRDLLALDDPKWPAWQEQVGFWPPYMESWSLIHFLKYGDGGEHESLLRQYTADLADGRDTNASAEAIIALQDRWTQWLSALQLTSTHGKFFEAIAAMLEGHLARCHVNGQDFPTMESFLAAADQGELRLGPVGSPTWLPASVMEECRRYMYMYGDAYAANGYGPFAVSLENQDGVPAVRVSLDNIGLHLQATVTISGDKVIGVKVAGLETIPAPMR